jgi:hypothetical protein
MPVLSYVHHLFNVAQCHAYIHTLRWKDRPYQHQVSLVLIGTQYCNLLRNRSSVGGHGGSR